MYLLGIGLVFLALKVSALSPVAAWSWWWVLSPFGAAVLWWAWADASGYTQRRAKRREDARRQAIVDRHRKAQGLPRDRGRR
ncbi:MAG: TIGR04438 family Trp-rich protein [Betaproteobacteria bacterium]|jgi:small Trp-rich protein